MLLRDRSWEAPKPRNVPLRFPTCPALVWTFSQPAPVAQPAPQSSSSANVRIAIVGLNHDHVWGILKDIEAEKISELVAIAETDQDLVSRAKGRVPPSVKFY